MYVLFHSEEEAQYPEYERPGGLLPAPPHLKKRDLVDCCQHLLT